MGVRDTGHSDCIPVEVEDTVAVISVGVGGYSDCNPSGGEGHSGCNPSGGGGHSGCNLSGGWGFLVSQPTSPTWYVLNQ